MQTILSWNLSASYIQDKSSLAKKSDNSRGRKPRPGFQLGSGRPQYASHVGVICMKMCTPMLAGAPHPKFPGNRPIEDESHIFKWITDMKYYAEYLINLCVPWLDESLSSFERSAEGFCLLVHAWSSKSATFITHQRFCFLSNFMSKGHQSSHNKTAATVWRQRNTDWWSEMKTAKHNTSPLAKTINKATILDDKAAG